MKTTYQSLVWLATLTSISFSQTPTAAKGPAPITLESLGVVSANQSDFLRNTKLFYDGRLRGEFAQIEGYDDASVLSLRSRFGFETGALAGFKFLAEGEYTLVPFNHDSYNPFPGGALGSKAIIADPDNIELNRLQLSWANENLSIIAGRQAIKYADERFVGSVGWRQNDQTYDALSLQYKPTAQLTFDYAYIAKVLRIFGTQSPLDTLEEWDSDSHLIRANYDAGAYGKFTAFANLLDFDNAPTSSYDTYGLEWQGSMAAGNGKATLLATAALQNDAADNPKDTQTEYFRLVGGYEQDAWLFQCGAEYLGTDHGQAAFQFPLATNHKYQGYADAFLTTPANGLLDVYASVGYTASCGAQQTLSLHHFNTIEDSDALGWEIDYVASKALNEHTKVLAKIASLDGENTQRDIFRASLELDVAF